MTRRVCYISGTRADYGLMRRTLEEIRERDELDLSVIVTGMHLDPAYGDTGAEILEDGFVEAARVPVPTKGEGLMAITVARVVEGCVKSFAVEAPDIVLLLGDRGEMLGAAIAAVYLNIPVVHIHGGERSGTVDEPVRHAISKLAHYHFVATEASRERLIRMGERDERVFVVGAPGLDGLTDIKRRPQTELRAELGAPDDSPLALLLFHPVVQQAVDGTTFTRAVLGALDEAGCVVLALVPNSDHGGDAIRTALEEAAETGQVHLRTHIRRDEFVSWMAGVDVMVGNSSAGIIEAASFGTPVVNVGDRQRLRERNTNVVDVPPERDAIAEAIMTALQRGRRPVGNVYGDGYSSRRIAELLTTIALDGTILEKVNRY